MDEFAACSTDSDDSVLAMQKLDSKDMSFVSPASSVSKLNNASSVKYNAGGGHNKLAELFRKDLISAMKLPDTESLLPDEYHLISDPWRQDWERGVQVPISPDITKQSSVVIIKDNEKLHGPYTFKLPKKYLHAAQDETYKQGVHELHGMQALADEVCRYDLDGLDMVWLTRYNELRSQWGEEPLDEWIMERTLEMLETQCYDGMQEAMKTVEGLGIEYDEDVVCDVCRSPEVEDDNEMVFCDGCDICVHQACYGILKVPKGNWLCKTCVLNLKPSCVLCPNTGGAMKLTEDGLRWAHLSCAVWIPEVTIGCSERMQPIQNIDNIPAKRKALICTICRERTGACIQCCVKKCKTAFHVTCAFEHNLEMKVNLEDDEDGDVQLKPYCPVHSKKHDVDGSPRKPTTSTPKKQNEMTEEERTAERSRRLQKLAEEFYSYASQKKVAEELKLKMDLVDCIYKYWVLKRKCNFNKALLTPKLEEGDILLKQREDTMVARLKMFIHLRQDLERVRNLCYMVMKREKLRTQLHRVKMQLFLEQVKILRKEKLRPNGREYKHICVAHKQETSLYDEPDKAMRTSKYFESIGDMKKLEGKPMPVLLLSKKLTPVKAKLVQKTPTENPYAKPTYKSFAWMLSSRRRLHSSTMASSEDENEASIEKRKSSQKRRGRRRKLTLASEDSNSMYDTTSNLTGSCSKIPKYDLSHTEQDVTDEQVENYQIDNQSTSSMSQVKLETEALVSGNIDEVSCLAKRRGRPRKATKFRNCTIGSTTLAPENHSLDKKDEKVTSDNSSISQEPIGVDCLQHNLCNKSVDEVSVNAIRVNGIPGNFTQSKQMDVITDDHKSELWNKIDVGSLTRPELNDLNSDYTKILLINHVQLPENRTFDCSTDKLKSQSEILVNNADQKAPAADKVDVTEEFVTNSLNSKHISPSGTRVNGKRLGLVSCSKSLSRRLLEKVDCNADDSGTSQNSLPTTLVKGNGVLKNQMTMDNFVQRLRRRTERDVKMKCNGSSDYSQLDCNRLCLNGRTGEMEDHEGDASNTTLTSVMLQPETTDNTTATPSHLLHSSTNLQLNSPDQKSGKVNSELTVPSKKRLKFTADGKDTVLPVCSTDDLPKFVEQSATKLFNDSDPQPVNGFSPKHRYPTRQTMSPN